MFAIPPLQAKDEKKKNGELQKIEKRKTAVNGRNEKQKKRKSISEKHKEKMEKYITKGNAPKIKPLLHGILKILLTVFVLCATIYIKKGEGEI